MKHVTAAEANRGFSRIMKEAEAGETIIVTSHGRPVVKIVPVDHEHSIDEAERERRVAAWNEYEKVLSERPVLDLGKFERDWAYED